MMTKTLSDTQTQTLAAAAQHELRLATSPAGLPAAARNAVFRSLLNGGLLEEVAAPAEHHDLGGRQEDDGWVALRITEAGLQVVGVAPDAGPRAADEAHVRGPTNTTARLTLRKAATSLLMAWEAGLERPALPTSIDALRTALAGQHRQRRPARDPADARLLRQGTKQQAVLSLLRRSEGATIAQVIGSTGWAQHTVRGFLAGLKKKGHAVEVGCRRG